jgi:glucosamine--fructose-6-phosphate aminotransferase (isomerizing)
MCGIIGYLGKKCEENILNGLKQLQNRGYDSAGICVLQNHELLMDKFASDTDMNAIQKLEHRYTLIEKYYTEHSMSRVAAGIGHTRWATHGPKTDDNSHPHMSMHCKFAIVHNGIIENYKKLKTMLISKGYEFRSQTDSEVIANLLEFEYCSVMGMDIEDRGGSAANRLQIKTIIQKTISQLEGTWGIAILCVDHNNTLFCTRHGSPLLISVNDDFAMVVSEQSGFCCKVENYHVLKNNNLCIIRNVNNQIFLELETGEPIEYRKITGCSIGSGSGIASMTPQPFPYWTIKEIFEQEESSLRAISLGGRIVKNERVKLGGLDGNRKLLKKMTNLIILGCGTSHYAGMLGAHYFKDICRFHYIQNIDAAEFTEADIPSVGNTVMILLSQSGETKDLYNCLEIGKKRGIFMIGVVNVVDSMIAREVNCGCYLNAGREVAVASTKSMTSQVILLSMIAIWFAQLTNIHIEKRRKYIHDLRQLNADIKTTIQIANSRVQQIINGSSGSHGSSSVSGGDVGNGVEVNKPIMDNSTKSCFVLGKGKAEAIAMEGSLKIKELSGIHAEGYSTSALKHGPFALLDENFPVIMIAANSLEFVKYENAYQEIVSRYAKVIFITDKMDFVASSGRTEIIQIPENSTYFELLSVIPLQFLAYYLCLQRGGNPDMPKNLAKVVSVE